MPPALDKLPDLKAALLPMRGDERGCPTGRLRQGGKRTQARRPAESLAGLIPNG